MPYSSSSYLFAFFISTSTPVTHGRLSSYTPSDPLGWVSRAILSGPSSALGYEIHPSLIELVQENTFSRLKLWGCLSSSMREENTFSNWGLPSAELELSSQVCLKFCWKEPLLNSQNLGERALHANPPPQIRLWCILLNFPRGHVSRKVEEGVVGRKWVIFYDSSISTTTPWKSYHTNPTIFPC